MQLGVIQTAYANGASTAFLSSLQSCGIQCTPTGVKYLHPAAAQYDVGIYFEANGHGTVLFSDSFLEDIRQVRCMGCNNAVSKALINKTG